MAVSTMENYPGLQKALSNNQRIVYMCGAGASMSLGSHRLNWPNWILAGREYLDPKNQQELDNRMGAWATDELIDAATFLLEQLKALGIYKTFMDSTIGTLHPINMEFREALRRIWRSGDLIATTNYDLAIEESIDADTITYSTPSEILSVIRADAKNKVIHLHGVYDMEHGVDDIVADDPQYEGIISNAGAQFIQNLIGTHTLIIVGCGGTLEDPNLAGLMSFVSEKLGATNIPYFYLMKNGDTIPNLPSNAVPIYYGDDYADLPIFLSDLAIYRLQHRNGIRSFVEVDPYAEKKRATSAFGRMHFSNRFNKFVGRKQEQEKLNLFLNSDGKCSWQMVLGDGGIGKSRLVLEWLKTIPSNWYGFYTRKKINTVDSFVPFSDTVIVVDYILGQEETCAGIIEAYMASFSDSSYKLRLILMERSQKKSDDDWLVKLTRSFGHEARLEFDASKYDEPLLLGPLSVDDEKEYIKNYLEAYLQTLPDSEYVLECKNNMADVSTQVDAAFRSSLDESCYRPLYLSIFTEVWIGKEGRLELASTEDLLSEFLNKEKTRWQIILNDDSLVDAYLRLLAVACTIERFNITDVYGNNYLEEDCKLLTKFLDDKSNKPGADNLFTDLFVSMDVLVKAPEEDALAEVFLNPSEAKAKNPELSDFLSTLKEDERFAYFTPFVKLSADHHETYLNMLVNADAAEEEEIEELERVREERKRRVAALPDHAWVIEPIFPDIIKEFVVSYVVNERDVVRFTKLARSNSVMGIAGFLFRALEDWPTNQKIQQIAITPPDEMLNYFEYYAGLLPNVRAIEELKPIETALVESDPLFQRFELELWRRIACVLDERGDIDRLYDSGCRFVEYLRSLTGMVQIKTDAAEVISGYCVGLHNAGEVEKHSMFLKLCDEVTAENQDNQRIGEVLCESYYHLANAKLYNQNIDDIKAEWNATVELLKRYHFPETMSITAMETAHDYMLTLLKRHSLDEMNGLEQTIALINEKVKSEKVTEVAALCSANLYTISFQEKKKLLSTELDKVRNYLNAYPNSMKIQSAYISMIRIAYLETSTYKRVPDKLLRIAKEWSLQYPDEIEFSEGYFGLLMARLEYAQSHGLRNEQRRTFREMKAVARRADYSKYNEINDMQQAVDSLQRLYGY